MTRYAARPVPQRILVLGDFRGDADAPQQNGLSERPLLKVDVDTLDDVLARTAPVVQLGTAAGGGRLEIRHFDDFHPDALVRTLTVLRRLGDLRARLADTGTFAAAVAELEGGTGSPALPAEATDAPPHSDGRADAAGLARLLGRRAQDAGDAEAVINPQTANAAAEALIRDAIAPYVVPAPSPQLPQMLSAVDAGMTDLMRAVLHDPAFQAVEASWRAVQWLISVLDLGDDLELRLLHVTRGELAEAAGPDGALWRRLVDDASAVGSMETAAIVGNFEFGPGEDDLTLLGHLGELAAAVGAPFLAGASPRLLGATSMAAQPHPRDWTAPAPDEAWAALRTQPSSADVCLALPRFLLRMPYGRSTDPIEAFAFEEQPPRPDHEAFLWGNAAFACAVVLARMLDPDADRYTAAAIEGLPAFVVGTCDEQMLQPAAEVLLSETAIDAILAKGLTPLVSVRDRDAMRVLGPRPLADPGV